MKKLVIGLLVAAAMIGIIAPQAAQAVSEVKISGRVLDQGMPVTGIQVMIECWATGFVERPITDVNGKFNITTTTLQCPLGTTLKLRSNTANNAKVGFTFSNVLLVNELNVNLLDTHGIPEYGWLGGVLAVGGGAGLIVVARRRYAVTPIIK